MSRSSYGLQLQPIVKGLMETLLEDHPTLLSDTDRSNLMNADYCKNDMGLRLSNLALLRDVRDRRTINGHSRFWAKRYADRYYVCSQWWKDHHCHNARMLRRFVDRLAGRNPDDPGILALKRHGEALQRFEQACRTVRAKQDEHESSIGDRTTSNPGPQKDRRKDRLTLGHTFQTGGETYYEPGTLAATLPEILPLAEQGHADAEFQLGIMHVYGEGVLEDNVEAVKWFHRAAEQGYPGAQNNLGHMYARGRGVPKNDAEAMKWFRMAAEQGVVNAQYNLGRLMYAENAWVSNDVEAHAWLSIAAAQGHKDAEQNREHIAKSMTPRRRRRTQKLAREYWEDYVAPFRK